jgi:phosphatidylglycerophosphate synthase
VLDTRMRALTAPPLQRAATRLAGSGISPLQLTLTGWAVGAGACVAAGLGRWHLALLLWLVNRLLDGLDGAVARVVGPTDRGGFLDLVADFSVYAGFVLGVAVAVPEARLACVALLTAYYLSGTAFLALSSLLEKRKHAHGDERSLRFVGGLAEGTETVAAYVALTLLPSHATAIVWAFSAAVAVTAAQRVHTGVRLLVTSPAAASGVPAPLSHVA